MQEILEDEKAQLLKQYRELPEGAPKDELILKIKINDYELKINGYELQLANTNERDEVEKNRLSGLISNARINLHDLNQQLLQQQQAIQIQQPQVAAITKALKPIFDESMSNLTHRMESIEISQHRMEQRLPEYMQTVITPSAFAHSDKGDVLTQILGLCGFGLAKLKDRVQTDLTPLGEIPQIGNFTFSYAFGEEDESASYAPLQKFLIENAIHVENVTNGKGLIDALLFREEIWTLKKNIFEKTNEPRLLKFILQGRTDFVRLFIPNGIIDKRNIRYFIEIKKEPIEEPELREAFYQLLGGNIANSYHSPPVFLTNLQRSHYVMFITLENNQNEISRFQLNIFKFPSFNAAVNYLEFSTQKMFSCTYDFLRKPTPLSTPPKKKKDDDSQGDSEKDMESKVTLTFVGDNDDSKDDIADNQDS